MIQPFFTMQHLFLLVGDNPLPTAVAVLTLLEENGTPYLVRTCKTQLVTTLPKFLRGLLRSCLSASIRSLDLRVTCQQYGFASVAQLCEWFDGIWLEHYVLRQIQHSALAADIHDSCLWFHIAELDCPWDKFEFDVAFVRHISLLPCLAPRRVIVSSANKS